MSDTPSTTIEKDDDLAEVTKEIEEEAERVRTWLTVERVEQRRLQREQEARDAQTEEARVKLVKKFEQGIARQKKLAAEVQLRAADFAKALKAVFRESIENEKRALAAGEDDPSRFQPRYGHISTLIGWTLTKDGWFPHNDFVLPYENLRLITLEEICSPPRVTVSAAPAPPPAPRPVKVVQPQPEPKTQPTAPVEDPYTTRSKPGETLVEFAARVQRGSAPSKPGADSDGWERR